MGSSKKCRQNKSSLEKEVARIRHNQNQAIRRRRKQMEEIARIESLHQKEMEKNEQDDMSREELRQKELDNLIRIQNDNYIGKSVANYYYAEKADDDYYPTYNCTFHGKYLKISIIDY